MSRSWHNQTPILHQLVRKQAQQTPDKVAAVYEDQAITYDELVARSAGWAHCLRSLGVDVGILVGLCLERSNDLPIIVLAILEAGGTCVPLEPSDPPQRIAAMILEASPSLILTQCRLRPKLPTTGVPVILIDEEPLKAAAPPYALVTANDLAFVLSTSGSTGTPKGVMISHSAVAARMFRSSDDLPEEGRCMAIMKTPINNAPFLGEMFAPLLHGCYFAIARPGGHQDIPYLGSLIVENRVSHIAMTATMLRAFLEWPGAPHCRSLEAIYCGGEAVTDELRMRYAKCFSKTRLVVTYGATEAGHNTSHAWVTDKPLDGMCVGYSIPGAQVHVLAPDLEPMPVGEVGEVYVSGSRLATGYLNHPAWTAERFVPHPCSPLAGDRLYRTGDLGRLEIDGMLELRGRTDQLVKVRGNRVELLEIEMALAESADIRDAVVLACANSQGDIHLVAYVVPVRKPGPTRHEIRSRLAERLPFFMVPQFIVSLDTMPLTPNGKVDRQVLREREIARLNTKTAFTPPFSLIEKRLTEIWKKILNIKTISINDDLFDLGGDSLKAVQIIHQIWQIFHVDLSLATIFQAPTVAQIAKQIENAKPIKFRSSLRLLKPGRSGLQLFLVHEGSGYTSVYVELAQHLPDTLTIYGLDPLASDQSAVLHTRIKDMASHYVNQVRQIQPEGPYFLGGLCAGGTIAFEMALQFEAQGQVVGLLALIESAHPLAPKHVGWIAKRRRAWLRAIIREFMDKRTREFNKLSAKIFVKIKSVAITQIKFCIQNVIDNIRFDILRNAVDSGRRIPWFVQSLPMHSVYIRAKREYVPDQILNAPLVLFCATGDGATDIPIGELFNDPLLGWSQSVQQNPELCNVPGGHTSLLRAPHVAVLADQFWTRLRAILSPAKPTDEQDA